MDPIDLKNHKFIVSIPANPLKGAVVGKYLVVILVIF